VAERSSLVRLQRELDVVVVWVGYELHPATPPGGIPVSEYLPDPEAMLGYVRSFAAGFGIRDLVPPLRLARTRRALAVAEHARDVGRLGEFRARAFDAYWREERGLESDDDLAALAREAGVDPGAAVAAARDPALLARVDAAGRAAREAGVSGIPTFDIGPVRVVGCQPYEVLAEAARRVGARPRRP
jgi:predicted DsbA family dithiol-disulfide isomerase